MLLANERRRILGDGAIDQTKAVDCLAVRNEVLFVALKRAMEVVADGKIDGFVNELVRQL